MVVRADRSRQCTPGHINLPTLGALLLVVDVACWADNLLVSGPRGVFDGNDLKGWCAWREDAVLGRLQRRETGWPSAADRSLGAIMIEFCEGHALLQTW